MRPSLSVLTTVILLAGCAAPYGDLPPYRPAAIASDEMGPQPTPSPVPPAGKPAALTLEGAIRLAMDNNRGVRIADRRILIARDRTNEQWTRILPTITANAVYQTRNNDAGSKFEGQEMVFQRRTTGTASVSMLVPMYSFGRAEYQLEAEHLYEAAADLSAIRAREDVAFAVSQAYFRLLEARKIRTVIEESIKVVERQLKTAQDFLEQGLVARSDVLTAEVQLAERRQELILAENNVELALAALNRSMGVDVDARTDIADVLEVAPWKGSYALVLRQAIDRRADLAALRKQIEAARQEYQATGSSQMPGIYAFADYYYSTNSFLINKDWLDGGISLQFPFFDGLATWMKLRTQEKEIAERIDRHDDRADDVVLEVKRAYLAVREAAQRIPVARKSIEQGEENLRIVRDQYAEGLLTSAEVLLEEDRLSRARSNYYRSLYDYHAAFAGLTHAIGGTPPQD